MTAASRYRDFGTPRLGSDRAMPPVGLFIRTPLFGRCPSRRKATQAATPTITATISISAPNPHITHSIATPLREIDV